MSEPKQKTVFERDYTARAEHLDLEITPKNKALVRKALDYQKRLDSSPYVVNEYAASLFDDMILNYDQIAKEFCGKLTATINYASHEATIELECLYAEFIKGEFMDVLREMAETALQIRFQPLTSGLLQITLIMPYFFPEI